MRGLTVVEACVAAGLASGLGGEVAVVRRAAGVGKSASLSVMRVEASREQFVNHFVEIKE
jgi:hypothetical protein